MFISKTSNEKVNKAIEIANSLLDDERLYDKIAEKRSYDMSTASSDYLAKMLRRTKNTLIINVNTYHNRWTRALGYFIPSKPNDVFINEAKLNRSLGSIVSSLYHERAHAMDYYDKNHHYGHGNNSPIGKQETFPYFLDGIAQSLVDGIYFPNNESSRIIYKRSIWSRVKSFFRRVF